MKKKIALLTALIVALYSLCAFSAPFSDMPEEDGEYYDAARYAIENGIISGDGNELMLSSPLTRAQAAVITARAASLPVGKALDASDVEDGAWYYCAAAAAVDAGLMALDDGKFLPGEPLNREDAFILLEKIYNVEDSADLSAYTDLSKLTPDGRGALSALVGAQVVKIKGSAIEPAAPVTRGEFVLWLYNAVMLDSPEQQIPTQSQTEATDASEPASDPTEPETQPNIDPDAAAESARALEIMRVSLGIRADGTSYIEREAYRDSSQEMDYLSSSRSSSSSSGSSTRPTNPKPTEPPTEKPTSPSAPTEPKTEPTAPPTEPSGGFDNDKDNTVDDPFDDDWKNPGGGDGENEDFFPNDDDDPEENPTKPQTPSEPETGGATEPETPTEPETGDVTEPEETPSEPETGDVTQPEEPTEETPSEPETGDKTEPEEPTEEMSSEPDSGDVTEPEETPSEPEEPSEPPIDMDGDSENENGDEPVEEIDAFVAAVFKAWWFI